MTEAFANIKLPHCPECGVRPLEARLNAGRAWELGSANQPTAELSCGHRLTGDAARFFRQGIADMYKIDP